MLNKLLVLVTIGSFISLALGGSRSFAQGSSIVPANAPVPQTVKSGESRYSSSKDFGGIVGATVTMRDAPREWKPVYTRSECMVQVEIDKNGKPITAAQWFKISFRAAPILVLESPKFGLAAYDYQERSRSLYLLYVKNCDEKFNITNGLFKQMKDSIIGFPDFEILHRDVDPSYSTLNICGHWWKDGEKNKCYIDLGVYRQGENQKP